MPTFANMPGTFSSSLATGCSMPPSVQEALRLVAKKPRISLVFTDVVSAIQTGGCSPTRSGRSTRFPVLFTTGYTRNAIVHQGRLDPDVHLLNKPFTQQDLARKVRELLDAAETSHLPQAAS